MPNNKTILIIGIIAITLAVISYMVGCDNGKRHNWTEHYLTEAKSPYGTSIIFSLMEDFFPDSKLQIIEDSLESNLLNKKNIGTYFFLGHTFWLDSLRINALLDFTKRGNDVFIISSIIDYELIDTLSRKNCIEFIYERDSLYYSEYDYLITDSIVSLNLLHPNLTAEKSYLYNFRYQSADEYYDWNILPTNLFCDDQTEFVSHGMLNDSLFNFAGIKYGEGHFYFHTTPLAFTNYHVVKNEGREYAEKVFSHINKAPILWDKTVWNLDYPGSRRGFGNSPLKYVLSQPSLAWAWYVLLGLAVLYLLFRAKRRQRIIPVLEQNENTSLEFINTIGRLYFTQSNHRQLALQKMKLFLGFVREHYNLSTKDINDPFKKQLSTKSEIPLPVIEKIFTIHENIERSKFTSENTLVTFHQEMERFYLECK